MVSTKESPIWAITCLAVAIITLSISPIVTRIAEGELGPCAIMFNRFWITSLALMLGTGVKILWDKQSERLPTTKEAYTIQDFFYLFLIASFYSAYLVAWALSLTKTSVANSGILQNTTPIFAILGQWLLLSQYINRRFLIGTSLSLGGTLIIAFKDFHLAQDTLIGDSFALMSAVFFAGALLVTEQLSAKFEATTILMWNCNFSWLLLLPCTFLFEDRLFPASLSGWLAVLAIGLLCNLIGVGALFYSLQQFSSSFVSVVLLLEPIIAAFLAWPIFGEQLSYLDGLMFVLVLSGIYVIKSDLSLKDSSSLET